VQELRGIAARGPVPRRRGGDDAYRGQWGRHERRWWVRRCYSGGGRVWVQVGPAFL
ncbi:hypothetical protein HK101_005587, partial [Irineochytrium annulatum]